MIAVADTSPIRYLVRIGEIDILSRLYAKVVLPGVVLDELQAEDGLRIVREWAVQLPGWVELGAPAKPLIDSIPNLHRGEREAIALAEELRAPLLLIDDRIGVKVALERGLTVTGTLGILVEAAQAGLVEIEPALRKLQETNFRATAGLYERALEMASRDPAIPPRRSRGWV